MAASGDFARRWSAWIATIIHAHALQPPERTPDATLRYRFASIAAGLAVFLIAMSLSVGSTFAILRVWIPPRFRPESIAGIRAEPGEFA